MVQGKVRIDFFVGKAIKERVRKFEDCVSLSRAHPVYFIRTFAFRFFESYLQRKAEAEKSEAEKSAGKAEKSSGKGKGVGKRSMDKEA